MTYSLIMIALLQLRPPAENLSFYVDRRGEKNKGEKKVRAKGLKRRRVPLLTECT